uniref:Putative product n=1 Tax=Xenopsylla cheopis TaxID=163159 RepID=A0A6M2E190_XENCH
MVILVIKTILDTEIIHLLGIFIALILVSFLLGMKIFHIFHNLLKIPYIQEYILTLTIADLSLAACLII